jgi:WD40 repeat protein
VAEEVLRALIDARLLTSYEVREEDEEPTRRVEIIHESLLANWPRLVRWQTQDADAVQLRDQLRQAAKTWDEQGRSDDTLWTGSAYREFAVWRESYPGGLSEIEEAFAGAMTSLATRRRRRRRIAVTSTIIALLVGLAIVGAFWRRSVLETRRAEAAKLLALGQMWLDSSPGDALAYVTSSLELADTYEARLFATRSLWEGGALRVLDHQQFRDGGFLSPAFSSDGRWIAFAGMMNEHVLVYGDRGGSPIVLGGHRTSGGSSRCCWTGEGLLVTGHRNEQSARIWAMPEGRLVRTIDFGETAYWQVGESHLLAEIGESVYGGDPGPWKLMKWELPGGVAEDLGSVDFWTLDATRSQFDPSGRRWIYSKGDSVYSRPLPVSDGTPDTLIARHSSDGSAVRTWRRPRGVYSYDSGGEIILWTAPDGTSAPGRRLRKPETAMTRLLPAPSGRWAADDWNFDDNQKQMSLWDLMAPPNTLPVLLKSHATTKGYEYFWNTDFHPREDWIVITTGQGMEATFWPLTRPFPFVAAGKTITALFTPDSRYVLTEPGLDRLRLWPLPGTEPPEIVEVMFPQPRSGASGVAAIDRRGEKVFCSGWGDELILLSLRDGVSRELGGFAPDDLIGGWNGDFSPSSRLVAAASHSSSGPGQLRVWDLETGEVRAFDQPEGRAGAAVRFAVSLRFVDESTLYTGGGNGVVRWDLDSGTYDVLQEAPAGFFTVTLSSDRRRMLILEGDTKAPTSSAVLQDLETGHMQNLAIPPGADELWSLSRDGEIWVNGGVDGVIWVGRSDGGDPHPLLGHEGEVMQVAISPDLRWVLSVGVRDETIRLWPMPDLDKPPLHTLPHDELIAKLHSLTNLRVVRDEESSTGWKLEVGPFPGWAEVPEW